MPNYTLEIYLESDTCFSLGAGISGLVDSEIQHDSYGLPLVSGKTLKGLLVNACSEILYVIPSNQKDPWIKAAENLFGKRGGLLESPKLTIGNASIAPDLAFLIRKQMEDRNSILPSDLIEALTTIRYQTAMSPIGAPKDESLRAYRVLKRQLQLFAPLIFIEEPTEYEKGLLAACVLGLKRAGVGRNRGKGKIKCRLTNRPLEPKNFSESERTYSELTLEWLKYFKVEG